MGYYTDFNLSIERAPSTEFEKQAIAELREMSEGANYAIDEDGYMDSPCKWYDWEADMRKVSERWPGFLFVLEGNGEDSNDQWIAYFLDGKTQFCKGTMIYPDFDEGSMI